MAKLAFSSQIVYRMSAWDLACLSLDLQLVELITRMACRLNVMKCLRSLLLVHVLTGHLYELATAQSSYVRIMLLK